MKFNFISIFFCLGQLYYKMLCLLWSKSFIIHSRHIFVNCSPQWRILFYFVTNFRIPYFFQFIFIYTWIQNVIDYILKCMKFIGIWVNFFFFWRLIFFSSIIIQNIHRSFIAFILWEKQANRPAWLVHLRIKLNKILNMFIDKN